MYGHKHSGRRLLHFFFPSRRRHTRWTGDWSSDVCSSDLQTSAALRDASALRPRAAPCADEAGNASHQPGSYGPGSGCPARSEERRVGKDSRAAWSTRELHIRLVVLFVNSSLTIRLFYFYV